jgi:hypothetical protein
MLMYDYLLEHYVTLPFYELTELYITFQRKYIYIYIYIYIYTEKDLLQSGVSRS